MLEAMNFNLVNQAFKIFFEVEKDDKILQKELSFEKIQLLNNQAQIYLKQCYILLTIINFKALDTILYNINEFLHFIFWLSIQNQSILRD
jgi:hypothetical protein